MTVKTAANLKLGDVVFDSYANPAVVLFADPDYDQLTIVQLTGSDCGHVAHIRASRTSEVPSSHQKTWALSKARELWRTDPRIRAAAGNPRRA